MVGAEGFEPTTLCSQSRCATRLRYAPMSSSIVTRFLMRPGRKPRVLPLTSAKARFCVAPRRLAGLRRIRNDATIDKVNGGYSSAAERLTVAQDVVGSIPTSRPIRIPEYLHVGADEFVATIRE